MRPVRRDRNHFALERKAPGLPRRSVQITPMDLFLDDSPKASGLHKGENADVDVMDDDRTRIGNWPVGRAGRSVGDGEDNIEDRVGDKQDNSRPVMAMKLVMVLTG